MLGMSISVDGPMAWRTRDSSVRQDAIAGVVVVGLATLGGTGCGFLGLTSTASLGGNTAGGRGTVEVIFINNTALRPVLTFGTYDNLDPDSQPSFRQITLDGDLTIEADGVTERLSLFCGRVFSVGSAELLDLIDRNVDDDSVEPDALVDGVEFFDTVSADPDAAPTGAAPPFEALLGVDFPCNSLLIIYLENDDSGTDPFRIDFQLIPSSTTR